MNRKWTTAIAGLALTATATFGTPAVLAAPAQSGDASTTTTAPAPPSSSGHADARPRLRALCARVPNLILRVERAINRLEGESDVRGSLAWLQTKIDQAKSNGRDALATVLENRLEVRTARLDLLKARLEALNEIDDLCDQHGA